MFNNTAFGSFGPPRTGMGVSFNRDNFMAARDQWQAQRDQWMQAHPEWQQRMTQWQQRLSQFQQMNPNFGRGDRLFGFGAVTSGRPSMTPPPGASPGPMRQPLPMPGTGGAMGRPWRPVGVMPHGDGMPKPSMPMPMRGR